MAWEALKKSINGLINKVQYCHVKEIGWMFNKIGKCNKHCRHCERIVSRKYSARTVSTH